MVLCLHTSLQGLLWSFAFTSASKACCALQKRDPLPAFKKYILDAKLASEADVKDIEKQVIAEVEESVKFADESPKPVRLQLGCLLACSCSPASLMVLCHH